jgi:hypothetical protein
MPSDGNSKIASVYEPTLRNKSYHCGADLESRWKGVSLLCTTEMAVKTVGQALMSSCKSAISSSASSCLRTAEDRLCSSGWTVASKASTSSKLVSLSRSHCRTGPSQRRSDGVARTRSSGLYIELASQHYRRIPKSDLPRVLVHAMLAKH